MGDNNQKKPNIFVRVYKFAKKNGLRCTIYRSLNRIANLRPWRRWFQVSIVNIYSVPVEAMKKADQLPSMYKVRPADMNDIDALGTYSGNHERVKIRTDRGDLCMLNECMNEISAMIWFSFGPNQYKEDWDAVKCCVSFPENVAWMYDGKGTKLGAWGCMMMHMSDRLRDLGVEEVYTMVDWENHRSIKSMKSLGLQQIGSYRFLKLFGMQSNRCKLMGEKRWRRLPAQIGKLELMTTAE